MCRACCQYNTLLARGSSSICKELGAENSQEQSLWGKEKCFITGNFSAGGVGGGWGKWWIGNHYQHLPTALCVHQVVKQTRPNTIYLNVDRYLYRHSVNIGRIPSSVSVCNTFYSKNYLRANYQSFVYLIFKHINFVIYKFKSD